MKTKGQYKKLAKLNSKKITQLRVNKRLKHFIKEDIWKTNT